MTVTVQDVMRQMRNYFIASTLTGTFTVADGIIDLDPPLAPGAWVAIEGSGSLDGVHQLDENGKLPDAADGSWRGLLHLLSPTADFLRLCRDHSRLGGQAPGRNAADGEIRLVQPQPEFECVGKGL